LDDPPTGFDSRAVSGGVPDFSGRAFEECGSARSSSASLG
jgi:hypothetical protein